MNESEINEFLEHFGVKGMRWGQRKEGVSSTPKLTTEQIKSARANQFARRSAYKSAKRSGNASETNKAAKEFLNNPDRAVAAHMTKGEKIAATLFAGGLAGLRPSAASNLNNGKVAADYVINSYLGVASIPVQKHRVKKIDIQRA